MSLDITKEVKKGELLVIFFKDDIGKFHCNKKVEIAVSLLQLDAILTYTEREVDYVLRTKATKTYK